MKKRFFLVSYVCTSGHGSRLVGNMDFESEDFPAKTFIIDEVDKTSKSQGGAEDVVITNIFEFKNESDFKQFRNE